VHRRALIFENVVRAVARQLSLDVESEIALIDALMKR
jgi:hypothetical protein